MTLRERIDSDYKTAFKERNLGKKTFLSVIKGEIENEASRTGNVTDETVLAILKKMEKSLKQINNDESKVELSYLDSYLPKLMSESDIRLIVSSIISDGRASNMGDVMRLFNSQYKGLADNSMVSKIAKEFI